MSTSADLEANKATKPNKGFYKHCKKKGHIEARCFIKYPELKNNKPSNKNNKKDKKGDNKNKKNESSKAIMSAFSFINNKSDYNYKLILDSGATEHYTPIKEWLIDYKLVPNRTIIIANGTKVPIEGVGDIPIIIGDKNVLIKDVYYIPSLKTTLISSKELTNKGWNILFKDNIAKLSNIKFKLNLKAKQNYNAYYLDFIINHNLLEPVIYNISKPNNKLDLIHKRLNHINKEYLIKTLNSTKGLKDNYKDLNKEDLNNCESCYISKFTKVGSKKPFLPTTSDLTHFNIDIAGPFRIKGLKGERYFITITDRGTRAIWVYALKFKADTLDIIISFYNIIDTQFNTKIKALRLDNAKEFKSSKWTLFCKTRGIICEYTSPYSLP